MKTFTLLFAFFIAVAFTEATNKDYIVGYLSTMGGAGATEEELKAKPVPELIDILLGALNERKGRAQDPEQIKLIENHIGYFTALKDESAESADSPASTNQQQVERSQSDAAGAKVIHIESEEDFDEQVKNAGSKVVVIDFFATWCGPCQRIAPTLDEFAVKYASQAVILKVDVDQLNDFAMGQYHVESMPTFVFLKDNKEVDRFSGAIADAVEENIKKFSA